MVEDFKLGEVLPPPALDGRVGTRGAESMQRKQKACTRLRESKKKKGYTECKFIYNVYYATITVQWFGFSFIFSFIQLSAKCNTVISLNRGYNYAIFVDYV